MRPIKLDCRSQLSVSKYYPVSVFSMAPIKKKKKKSARLWWQIHQIVGLKLSLLLSFILLTGTLAVLSHEIDWLIQPSLRVDSETAPEQPNWPVIVSSVANHPDVTQVRQIYKPRASFFAVKAMVVWKNDQLGFLHVHPGSGVIQGKGPWVGAQRVLRDMHRALNIPTFIGVPIVTSLSFLMLISFITAFVVYPKWWRGFFKPIRWTNARTAFGDFHRLAGLWSLWLLFIITITSAWYFIEYTGGDAPDFKTTSLAGQDIPLSELAERFPENLKKAQDAYPSLEINAVGFPSEQAGAFRFSGQGEAILVRDRANYVHTNPLTTEALLVHDGQGLSLHSRISEMADPLHFGTFGGYWTIGLYFFFGIILTALSISGSAIYALRILKAEKSAPNSKTVVAKIWYGMGRWRWAAAGLTTFSFVALPFIFVEYMPG